MQKYLDEQMMWKWVILLKGKRTVILIPHAVEKAQSNIVYVYRLPRMCGGEDVILSWKLLLGVLPGGLLTHNSFGSGKSMTP